MRALLRRWRHRVLRVTLRSDSIFNHYVDVSRINAHHVHWYPTTQSVARLLRLLNDRHGHFFVTPSAWHWASWYHALPYFVDEPSKEKVNDH